MGTAISASISWATERNPPNWVLVSLNSSMAAAPASGRNDAKGVGTGEKVLVSCIIEAITILRRAIGVSGAAVWGRLLQHGFGDARELSPHLGLRLHRIRPHHHARGAGVEKPPDEVAVGRLPVHRDRDAGGIAASVLGQPIERGATLAQALGREAV